jgi:phosphate-selective porin OprO/OprP
LHTTNIGLVDTNDIKNIDRFVKYGLEASIVAGPFSMQAEYFDMNLERMNGFDDVDFDGGYIQAAYALTGESRKYKVRKGVFGSYSPKGKNGAWEIAVRYDAVDLDDDTIQGDEQDVTTLGLNWYVNKNVRVMLNYANVDSDRQGVDDDVNQIGMRTQFKF